MYPNGHLCSAPTSTGPAFCRCLPPESPTLLGLSKGSMWPFLIGLTFLRELAYYTAGLIVVFWEPDFCLFTSPTFSYFMIPVSYHKMPTVTLAPSSCQRNAFHTTPGLLGEFFLQTSILVFRRILLHIFWTYI